MEYIFALGLGFLGSLHCGAMCGPLMLALPAGQGGAVRFIAGRLLYQGGRIGTYVLMGLIAGTAGRSLMMAGVQRWVSIALGAAILAGYFLSHSASAHAHISRFASRLKTLMSGQLRRNDMRALLILGFLNGLLPCGLVYVALADAMAVGSVIRGMAHMALFGAGTLPLMLAASLFGKTLPTGLRLKLRLLIPVGIFLLASTLILRGLALGIPYISPDLLEGGCCAH